MSKVKIAITLEDRLLRRLDQLVAERQFASRSGAIGEAVAEQLRRLDRSRLARECAKLDAAVEQSLADEGLAAESAS